MATQKAGSPAKIGTVKAKGRPPAPGSPNELKQREASARELASAGRALLENPGKPTFTISKTPQKVRDRVIELSGLKDDNDAELAFSLLRMKQAELYLGADNFTSVEEWAAANTVLSKERVKALISVAETAETLKLSTGHFGRKGLSFSKFREIAAAVNRGDLTPATVFQFYPQAATAGPMSQSVPVLKERLRAYAASGQPKLDGDKPEKMRRFGLGIPASQHGAFVNLLDVYKKSHDFTSDGEAIMDALTIAVAEETSDDLAREVGVVSLRDSMVRLQPDIIPVLFSNVEVDAEDIGLPIIKTAFMPKAGTPRIVIATSIDEAAKMLGTDDIVEVPLSVSVAFSPPVRPFDIPAADSQPEANAPQPTAPESPVVEKSVDPTPEAAPESKPKTRKRKEKASPAEEAPAAPQAAEAADPVVETPAETPAAPTLEETPEEPKAPSPMDPDGDEPDFDADDVGTIIHVRTATGVKDVVIDTVDMETKLLRVFEIDANDQKKARRLVIRWADFVGLGRAVQTTTEEAPASAPEPIVEPAAPTPKKAPSTAAELKAEIARLGKLCASAKKPDLAKQILAEYTKISKAKGFVSSSPDSLQIEVLTEVVAFGRVLLSDNGVNADA